MPLDTSFHRRYFAEAMEDPEFRCAYEVERNKIDQVDAVVRALDTLRIEAGLSKAELARRISKHPAAVRRLFSSDANPELSTIAALATALGAEIKIVPNKASRASGQRRSTERAVR